MKIQYFAWLRERLNRESEDVEPPASVQTVAGLIAWLRLQDGAADLAMQNPALIRAAVDSRIVAADASIVGARLVALFPPMTGG